jgi:hypothetical protein
MKRVRAHLSYANLMSTLAVFLLLGGATAIAAKKQTQKIGTTQIKASAITTAKIKNTAVDGSKLKDGSVTATKIVDGAVTNPKLAEGAVTTGKIAVDAVTGDQVRESSLSEVPSANSANPTAFAHVNSNGVVDAANSKGITSPNVVKAPGTGVYCVTVPSFVPRGAQVSAQANGATATSANLALGGTASCGAPSVQVLTFGTAGAATDLGFYIELYR